MCIKSNVKKKLNVYIYINIDWFKKKLFNVMEGKNLFAFVFKYMLTINCSCRLVVNYFFENVFTKYLKYVLQDRVCCSVML